MTGLALCILLPPCYEKPRPIRIAAAWGQECLVSRLRREALHGGMALTGQEGAVPGKRKETMGFRVVLRGLWRSRTDRCQAPTGRGG
jgi:hypothetical protein